MEMNNIVADYKDYSVSIAKGIGIILMVLAHTGFSYFGGWMINLFHMPLFFFLSGYCFKDKYLNDAKGFTIRRFKGIYVPYVKWCIVFILAHNILTQMHLYEVYQYFSAEDILKQSVFAIFLFGGGILCLEVTGSLPLCFGHLLFRTYGCVL